MDGSCPECRADVIERSAEGGASSTTRGADRESGIRGEVQLELLEFARPAVEDGAEEQEQDEGGRSGARAPSRLDV